MAVLTKQEYKEKKRVKVKPNKKVKEAVSLIEKEPSPLPVNEFLYIFQHPEVPLNGSVNTSFEVIINDEKKEIDIKGSLVKTKDNTIADYLKKNQYIFIEKIKLEENNVKRI